ncbi:hypothetical protein BGX34_002935 [Mortierella sp. NVP85]|nr:hypothetical protein BGX34_002935 [Mortierella sp. NVP85]
MPSVEVMRQQLRFLRQPSEGNKKALKDRLRKYIKKHPDTVAILSAAKLQDDDAKLQDDDAKLQDDDVSDHDEEGQKLKEGHSAHGEDKDQDTVRPQHQEPPPSPPSPPPSPPPQQQQEQHKEQKQKEEQELQQEREQAQRCELVEKTNGDKQKYEARREREKRNREERQKQAQEKQQEREQRIEKERKAKREQELKHAQESSHKNGAKSEPEPEPEQEQKPTQELASTQAPLPANRVEQESSWKQVSRHALHKNSRYDYYLCFDVEATCEEGFSFEFPNEVIEFPVVLLDGTTLEVIDEFHSYVRPVYRPTLSKFCTGLTGITQETIDDAPIFTDVLVLFQDWLKGHGIILGECGNKKSKNSKSKHRGGGGGGHHNNNHHYHHNNNHSNSPIHYSVPSAANDFIYGASFCFVTDGPFDIRDFIGKQCLHSQIPRPSYFAQSYLDVRTLFRDFFNLIQWCNLEGMLTFLGESFTGRQHSGICDTRMVALILKRLAEGFSKEEDHAIFADRNKPLVSPQWSYGKFDKLKQGCVLKANRSTDHTYVKMITFSKLEQIEARTAAALAAAAAAEAKSAEGKGSGSKGSGAKGAGAKGADGKVDSGKDGFGKDGFGKDGFGKDGFGKDGFGKDGFGKDGFVKDTEGSKAAGKKEADKKSAASDGKDKGAKGKSAKGAGTKDDDAIADTKAADGKDTSAEASTTADNEADAKSSASEKKDTPQSPTSMGFSFVSTLLSAFTRPSPKPKSKKKKGGGGSDIKADTTLPTTLSISPASPPVQSDSHSLSSSSSSSASSSASSPTEPFVSSSPYSALMLDLAD